MAAVAIANPGGIFGLMSIYGRIGISAAFNGIVSYAQTGSIGAGLETAAFTYASEFAWVQTGNILQSFAKPGEASWEADHVFASSMVHGGVGGGLNLIEGGSFKNGFLSAAVSQARSCFSNRRSWNHLCILVGR